MKVERRKEKGEVGGNKDGRKMEKVGTKEVER